MSCPPYGPPLGGALLALLGLAGVVLVDCISYLLSASMILLEAAPYALAMAERVRRDRGYYEEPALIFRFPN